MVYILYFFFGMRPVSSIDSHRRVLRWIVNLLSLQRPKGLKHYCILQLSRVSTRMMCLESCKLNFADYGQEYCCKLLLNEVAILIRAICQELLDCLVREKWMDFQYCDNDTCYTWPKRPFHQTASSLTSAIF